MPVKTVDTTTSGAQVNMNGVDMLELYMEVVQGKIKYVIVAKF